MPSVCRCAPLPCAGPWLARLAAVGEERICRQLGSLDGLCRSLGGQANILYACGQLDQPWPCTRKRSASAANSATSVVSAKGLGNQANILCSYGTSMRPWPCTKKKSASSANSATSLVSAEAWGNSGQHSMLLRQPRRGHGLAQRRGAHLPPARQPRWSSAKSLGNQANISMLLWGASTMPDLHKETERIFRQLGNLDCLSISLDNQADIFFTRKPARQAMALRKEEERICRQLGKLDSLQRSLGNQAAHPQGPRPARRGHGLAQGRGAHLHTARQPRRPPEKSGQPGGHPLRPRPARRGHGLAQGRSAFCGSSAARAG